MCNHIFVDGFGMMGDALTCAKCGLSKYPEALSLLTLTIARLQGKIITDKHPDYQLWVKKVQDNYNGRTF